MRYVKLVVSAGALLLCFLVVAGSSTDPDAVGEEHDIVFRWAFGALVGPKADRQLVAVTRDTTLSTGDELKMLVDLRTACFVYLIYRSSQGQTSLLFPGQVEHPATDSKVSITYYVPEGQAWFRLDSQEGLERFYLLASAKPLTDLEKLLRAHGSAKPSDRVESADQILAHIRDLRRKHRTLKAGAERPVSIAGNVRGATSDLEQIAVEISATGFYSKTFTIDHRE